MLTSKRSLIILFSSLTIILFSCTDNNPPAVSGGIKDSLIKSDSVQYAKHIPKQISPSSGPADEIAGTYNIVNEPVETDKCSMTITISKDAKGYTYSFTSDSRSLKGKLSVETTAENNGYYITLEGIEWSEYEGELDDEGEPKAKEGLDLPVGVDALLQDHSITLQNYGNSMNYYVKLADCSKKYIVLKKQ
ncbi:hypothetical protein [Pedobacter frigidisoli]|uniref:hypothetical protein n=1 Tax=Pedobacter frigidisoli TaxID=2530455 RepID=UPI002931D8E3|nr:hypothetical protein [Pedobacter frigidisoli]